MNIDEEKWFLDFHESDQMWHLDTKRVRENNGWVNIGYGTRMVLNHFCDIVDVMTREFGKNFSTEQIIRLAECTPGLTVHYPTPLPDDPDAEDRHMAPIWSRENLEKHIIWKLDED